MTEGNTGFSARDSRVRAGAWESKTVNRLYTIALRVGYVLLFQSLILLTFQNDSQLKLNLVMQIAALIFFALFTRGAAGTYLNAPLVFAASIFMWHSTFLVGYYFEVAPIFLFPGNAFNVGFEYIHKATALVGLALVLTMIGMIHGYKRERIEVETSRSRPPLTTVCYSSLGSESRRIAWYLFSAMVVVFALYAIFEGHRVFSQDYIDLYADQHLSAWSLLFLRSEFLWAFVIVLLIACYKDAPRTRNLLAILFVTISVSLVMFGPRTAPFMCLSAILLSWDCFVRRIKVWFIIGFVLCLSASSFVIATARESGLGAHVFQFSGATNNLDLLEMFYEQGKSIKTVLRTLEFSRESGLVHGRTIFDSALSVVPLPVLKLTGYRPAESPGAWIVDNSSDLASFTGLGSSLIAELYYNFGTFGSLAFFFIGRYISRLHFKYVFSGNVFSGLQATTLASMYTITMRDDTTSYLRLIIYAFIIVAFLKRKREESYFGLNSSASSNRRQAVVPQTS